MFDVNTTLVLGAGASCGYGYPLGYDLIDKIIGKCRAHTAKKNLNYQNSSEFKLKELLEFYDPISIDSFLYQFGEASDRSLETAKSKAMNKYDEVRDSALPQ